MTRAGLEPRSCLNLVRANDFWQLHIINSKLRCENGNFFNFLIAWKWFYSNYKNWTAPLIIGNRQRRLLCFCTLCFISHSQKIGMWLIEILYSNPGIYAGELWLGVCSVVPFVFWECMAQGVMFHFGASVLFQKRDGSREIILKGMACEFTWCLDELLTALQRPEAVFTIAVYNCHPDLEKNRKQKLQCCLECFIVGRNELTDWWIDCLCSAVMLF